MFGKIPSHRGYLHQITREALAEAKAGLEKDNEELRKLTRTEAEARLEKENEELRKRLRVCEVERKCPPCPPCP